MTALDLTEAARTEVEFVLEQLGTSAHRGLSKSQVAEMVRAYGPNTLAYHRVTPLGILVRQLRNPLLILLLLCAMVSGLTGDATDALIISGIVILSVVLSFVNEFQAENAAEALHSQIQHRTMVLREGHQRSIDATDLVPGDIVALAVGNIVPADVRLIQAVQLECDEAVLTGESIPVEKSIAPLTSGEAIQLSNCALMGTVVHQGFGQGVVVSTGTQTQFGSIAKGLNESTTVSGFQAGMARFSGLLVRVALTLSAMICVLNIAFHKPLLDALLFSLAIAVGITPTLLPAIVTVSLSHGARILARQKVLVKRLVAIEDLGNIQILFTDKTGTLTDGAITFDQPLPVASFPAADVLRLGLICNESNWEGDQVVGGNALDQALLLAPEAHQLRDVATKYRALAQRPFSHERQSATVLVEGPEGRQLIRKGAPEAVLRACADVSTQSTTTLNSLFQSGSRVVAVVVKSGADLQENSLDDDGGFQLKGFLTFVDRPKESAGASMQKLLDLGVEVKIVTGDNGTVAATVCNQIGVDPGQVLTGEELNALTDDAAIAKIAETRVFARVSPEQKSRIIRLARWGGADVAFLGDGVNDAVALHHADVGISVDSATDVAKDAADIVLLDKDLGILADGVLAGRQVFANTIKYVLMATSSNFGNMFSAAAASVFLSFLPMLPSQILLNNLLYDTGQLAIPTDRVDAENLARPAAWNIAFIRQFMMIFGPISSLFDFLTFFIMLQILHASVSTFRTGWFVESIATQTLVIYVIRTRRAPFFRSTPSQPMTILPVMCAVTGAILPYTPLASVLGFEPLPAAFFIFLIAMTVVYLILTDVAKHIYYGRVAEPKPAPAHHLTHRSRIVLRRMSRFIRHPAPSAPRTG